MIEAIINASLKNRLMVLVLTAMLLVWGIHAIRNIPLDAIPDLSDVQVIVKTSFPGQAPQVVEDHRDLDQPLEELAGRTPDAGPQVLEGLVRLEVEAVVELSDAPSQGPELLRVESRLGNRLSHRGVWTRHRCPPASRWARG